MTLRVVGFAGWSGSGKTTLIEQVIPLLREAGQWVAVIKHAHCKFDIDVPGKDSWRHRQAGACEVVVASARRTAVMREREVEAEQSLPDLISELRPPQDGTPCWVLVEGFKFDPIPKIEVWRAACGQPLRYPDDPRIVALATDPGHVWPTGLNSLAEPALPVLNLSDPKSVAAFLLDNPGRYDYSPEPR
jgi:molybdopterin-guanine dinucleotide biosynthesis protein B